MIYHYCRVSSREQNLDRQLQALSSYRQADKVFCDKQSGKDFERVQYQAMKSILVSGDEIIVKELDRLGRNKDDMKKELEWFRTHGVILRILDLPTTLIDFQGQDWVRDMVNNILVEVLGSIAEQERVKIRTRQREGIDAMAILEGKRVSKKTGRAYGRQAKQTSDFEKFLKMQKDGKITVGEAVAQLGISRSTWYARSREAKI